MMTDNVTCDRRKFLSTGAAVGAGVLSPALWPSSLRAQETNRALQLGFIGLGGRGIMLLPGFMERDDCSVRSLCDVNEQNLEDAAKKAELHSGRRPLCFRDLREMLADDQLDAVVIATPDHWHCVAAAWACRAGKHVYVEKPLSHSIWEGRRLVQIARENDRVVQVGMQSRSAPYTIAARKYIESGKLGRILMCRVYNQKDYPRFPLQPDGEAPQYLDWPLWNGACVDMQFNPTRYKNWHDFWRYSGGGISNDGVHQVDLACMVLGIDQLPNRITSLGYPGQDTASETPYVLATTFQFNDFPFPFLYEQTFGTPYILKTDFVVRDNDMFPYWKQNSTRIEIFGTEGVMFLGRHGGGWQVFDRPKNRQPVVKAQMYGRFPDAVHKEDFVRAIREGRRPNADVEIGHRSAALAHLANISFRVGNQQLEFDPDAEQFTNHDEANKRLKREYRTGFSPDSNFRAT